MEINSAFYVVDTKAPYSEDFCNALVRNFNSVDSNLGKYVRPERFSFVDGESLDKSLQEIFENYESDRAKAVREGQVANFRVRDFDKRGGRNAPLLHLIVDFSAVGSDDERQKFIDRLNPILEMFAGCVIIALSENDIEFNDDVAIKAMAEDFKRISIVSECWIRVVAGSFGRRLEGQYVIKEEIIERLARLIAQDSVYKEKPSERILCHRPPYGLFSFEIFAARFQKIDVDALLKAILPHYRAGLVGKIRADGDLSHLSPNTAKETLEGIVDGTGFSLEARVGDRLGCKTKNDDYALGTDVWRYEFPGFSKKRVDRYLRGKDEEFAAAERRFVQTTGLKISKLVRNETASLEDSVLKAALRFTLPNKLADFCQITLDGVKSRFEVKTDAKRDETLAIACEEELDRFPRFFPNYLISTTIFTFLTGLFIYYWRFKWAVYSAVGATASVGIWLILRQIRRRKCEEAIRADYERIKTRWLNNAVASLTRQYQDCWRKLGAALGDKEAASLLDEGEKIVDLRAFALSVQKSLTEASRVPVQGGPNSPFFSTERVSELIKYLREQRGFEGKQDVEAFKETAFNVAKTILDDEGIMTTEFNEAVDKFCRDRLQKVLNELNLPFFLRDDFSTKRFNSARLMEVMRLDNGDIYARGSLTRKMVGAIPSDMSDIIPVTPRTFILTPAGVEIGDREAHGYRNVRTNWTRECLSARFWNMYRPEIKDETKNDEN